MRAHRHIPISNQLIAGLPKAVGQQLLALGQVQELSFGVCLCVAGERYAHVYFPLDGCISLVTTVEDHGPLEIGLIGSEGMLGATLALDVLQAPASAVVQGEGLALCISAGRLRQALVRSPALRAVLQRYVHVLLAQQPQLTACIHFHTIQSRLARWLLMMDDRIGAESFGLTHAYLANMLGVTRSGISIAAGHLQALKLIRYSRGAIQVLDRVGLERASCTCYAVLRADYARQFD